MKISNTDTDYRLREYISSRYRDILDEDEIDKHISDYVGLDVAKKNLEGLLRNESGFKKILDIGCGFGSFVLCARMAGIDAIGVDVADFEIDYARARFKKYFPNDNSEYVYQSGSGTELPFEACSFDAVTLWNILEHVKDYKRMLYEAFRVLKPSGKLYIVCPNYFSFRLEAHYHLFWLPYLPKRIARYYLKALGRDPRFLNNEIFYLSNWGVLSAVKDVGFVVRDPRMEKIENPFLIGNAPLRNIVTWLKKLGLSWFLKIILVITFYNPFKQSIYLCAKKPISKGGI